MKKITFNKVMLALFAVCALIVAFVFTPAAGIAIATTGLVAGAGEITTHAVAAAEENLNMEDISTKVTEILPARVPLNKIMREIRKSEKAESQELRYYSVISKDVYDTTLDSASGAGTSSSVPALHL